MDIFNKNKLFSGFSIAIVALILSLGLSYALAQTSTWTAPQCAPPGCNVDAPLNVGSSHQSKLGSVSINTTTSNPDPFGLDVFGISRFFGNVQIGTTTNGKYATIQIVDGNQGAGKVLTSDGNGNASWQTLPNVGPTSSGDISYYYDTNGGQSLPPASFQMTAAQYTSLIGSHYQTSTCTKSTMIPSGKFVGINAGVHGGGIPSVTVVSNKRRVNVSSYYTRWQQVENPILIVDIANSRFILGYTGYAGSVAKSIPFVSGESEFAIFDDTVLLDNAGLGITSVTVCTL